MQQNILDTSLTFLKGVGPNKAALLEKELQLATFGDLLMYFPFRYIDKSSFHKIRDIQSSLAYVQIIGCIRSFEVIGKLKGKRLVAHFEDGKDAMELIWFQGIDYVLKNIKPDVKYVIFGKPNFYNGGWTIAHPEIELFTDQSVSLEKKLMPVYSITERLRKSYLDSKAISKLTEQVLSKIKSDDVLDYLPDVVIKKNSLISRFEALTQIHYPTSDSLLEKAQQRLKFDELFSIQFRLLYRKKKSDRIKKGIVLAKVDGMFTNYFKEHLPFNLTSAQTRVLKEIRKDSLSGRQMNRLLQGDVGSGKTIVALMSMLMAVENGFQACIMAPTEILAQQHYEFLLKECSKIGVIVALLTGSTKVAARKSILQNLEEGKIQILVGTHALIEKTVLFKNLAMVIIDEQHRFGVNQRAQMWTKSDTLPHILVMTATPIPRTLAKTFYGDLDVSVLDELPPGRKPIQTFWRFDSARLNVFNFMRKEIAEGRQIYIVYPLIDESEKLDLKHLMDGYESISRAFPLPQYKTGILHGKMKPADKEFEMQRFARGETQILVATTVIEVGVNVPNASVMIIENAERFGLSQLHQLRGRVGRGAVKSYCILMSGDKVSADARKRLEVMCSSQDGFLIAEEDLKIRGPGDMDGTKQSGLVDLKLADLALDGELLDKARNCVLEILDIDDELKTPIYAPLRVYMDSISKGKVWADIG